MKKVRYMWGAVGAVPALAVMPTAIAATAHAPEATAKTVSLQHGAATAAGCTGSTVAKASTRSVRLKFWHTYDPAYDTSCIGTVSAAYSQSLGNFSWDRVRVYARSIHGAKHMVYHASPRPPYDQGKNLFAVGVHQSFGYPPIQVCVAAVSSFNADKVIMGPVCKSVG